MKKQTFWRAFFYCLGVVFLSIGITINTRTGLGLSCVTAVPYSVSEAFSIPFSTAIFWYYILCVVIQVAVKGRKSTWKEFAQFPMSYVFSAVQAWIAARMTFSFSSLWQSALALPFAVCFTGFGIALMVNMELVPNPADGVPVVLSAVIKKSVGLSKNITDTCCVLIALAVDLLFTGGIVSLGVGTVAAMIFNGRAVALFDKLFKNKIKSMAGLITIC